MTHLKERWEGVSLSGDYTLEQWLSGDERAAFFQTSVGPGGRRAIVKLVPESAGGNGLLDLWERTRQLRHPNLIELMDCGCADQSGEVVYYAVSEAPEDTLTAALSRSPLDQMESREVLDSVIQAIRYLHAQGMAHGEIDSDHIFAVGDRVKLSTDALHEADTSSVCREDVRLLGELWQQSLMPASSKSAEIAAHAADRNPQTRWTLAEISAALEPLTPMAPPEPEPTPVLQPTPEPAAPEPLAAALPVSEQAAPLPPAPTREERPILPPPRHPREEEPPASRPVPKWIFAATGALLFLILALTWTRSADVHTAAPPAPVSLPPETPEPVAAPKVASPNAASPKAIAPKLPPPETPRPASPKPSQTSGKEIWRVIAFTYRTRDAAAKKVKQLNEHHPGINATVFSPTEKTGYYLVSLGGRMTYDQAVRLQRTARGKGLPRDLYVQNYSK